MAVEILLEADGWGETVSLAEVWEAIDAVVPRAELRAAVTTITGMVLPPDADDDGDWQAELGRRIVTVSGFLKMLVALGIEVDQLAHDLVGNVLSEYVWAIA